MKFCYILPAFFLLLANMCFGQVDKLYSLPDSVFSGVQGRFHVQGVALDKKNGFFYFSFTDRLIKTDLSGKVIGSVVGIVGHLGDLVFHEETGKVFASLEYKNDAIGKGITDSKGISVNKESAFYIAIFDGAAIIKQNMNAESDEVIRTVYLREVVQDFEAESKIGDNLIKHRFGCSGIDGITIGPDFGHINTNEKYLYVAYGVYSDTTRGDNNHQVLLKYDISNWDTLGRRLSQHNPHHFGPDKPMAKYFVKTGNTRYGIQNLAYDKYTGNFFAAVYPGVKSIFPNYSLFVIDGRKKPVKRKVLSFNKKIKVHTLSLLDSGLKDGKTGIRGWHFNLGSTGLLPLGDGLFYISHNNKRKDGGQETILFKYEWTGSAENAFIKSR